MTDNLISYGLYGTALLVCLGLWKLLEIVVWVAS